MNTGRIAVVFAAIIVVAGITCAFVRQDSSGATRATSKSPPREVSTEIIHVDDLAQRLGAYQGELTLSAVVAGVNQSEGVISVIDSREFETCGTLDCARNYIPVKMSGELPKPKTRLQITGRIARTNKGLVFESGRVETVK